MITTKKNKKSFACTFCGANHVKYAGRCHHCQSWNTIQESDVPGKKDLKTELAKWFEFQIQYELDHGPCKCMNCGKPIRHQLLSKDLWVSRGSIAHVIPKRPNGGFPSVATHIHNFIILCLSCHNDEYDNSWEKATQMPVFEIAKTKFKLFRDCVKEPLSKIEKYFE